MADDDTEIQRRIAAALAAVDRACSGVADQEGGSVSALDGLVAALDGKAVTCKVCGKPGDDVRLMVRDDYEMVRGSYAVPLTPEDQGRVCGVLDRIVDGYTRTECRECRRKIALEAELEYAEEHDRGEWEPDEDHPAAPGHYGNGQPDE